MTDATATAAMTCVDLEVLAVVDPAPGFRRLLVGGTGIDTVCPALRPGPETVSVPEALDGSGPGIRPVADAYIKILVPAPGRDVIRLDVRAPLRDQLHQLEADGAGWMRTYTVRAIARVGTARGTVPAMVVDVALHGDPAATDDPHQGPGLRWARAARPGDHLSALLPGAGVPPWSAWAPQGASGILAIGDETAAPALVSIALALAADETAPAADVLIELPPGVDLADRVDPALLADEGRVRLRVGRRAATERAGSWALRTAIDLLRLEVTAGEVLSRPAPVACGPFREWSLAEEPEAVGDEDVPYVFIAGESAMVRSLRRLVVSDAGIDRSRVSFMGYWREGRPES